MSTSTPEEHLIELLLDRGPEAAQELLSLRSDPRSAARIAELERLLHGAAEAVQAPVDATRAGALSQRILAQTTREDLSWRGDLQLLRGYVRDRMRESRLARYLAALLIGNLTVAPAVAVAWVLTHDAEPERQLFFQIEPAEDDAFEEVADELAPLDDVELDGFVEPDRIAAEHLENRLRRARYLLSPTHGAVPAPARARPDDGAPLAVRLLDLRSRLLAGEAWPTWLDDEVWETDARELAVSALYVEVLLDRYLLSGERAPRFHGALAGLEDRVNRPGAALGPADEAARRLSAATLERAGSYGLLPGDPPATARDPLDAAWRADLAAALPRLANDPTVSAWAKP